MADRRFPLSGARIVERIEGPLGPATRMIAELGADVVHVAGRNASARFDALDPSTREGLEAIAGNVGKRWMREDDEQLATELARADMIVTDGPWAADQLRKDHPAVIIVACSPFGQGNSLSDWHATDPVLHALSAGLSRSGIRGRAPLLPPGDLAYQCASAQLAYVILLALFHRQRTGKTDLIDFSVLDAAMQTLDPGFGISGSATMGRPARLLSPDRPMRGISYPIFPCTDGQVRIYLGAARQWQGLFEWMGRPEEFASPDMAKMAVRLKTPTLYPAIGRFFADKTRAELETGAAKHGVPLSAMLTRSEAVSSDQVDARGLFRRFTIREGLSVLLPDGVMEIDHQRMGSCGTQKHTTLPVPRRERLERPLSGLKVLDLGVIVVGGEQGRLLADHGADVIKLESRAFPDGTRQTDLATGMAVSLATGHRNKRSLGLNLRVPEGKALFERMVAQADVVLTNFKPGTMESLGLGYVALKTIKPDIIMVESSAFGDSGPWAKRMGYGPLVRAATGLSGQWCYPNDPEGHSDSLTIYPDHVAARIGIIGVLALLIDRDRCGTGGLVSTAQMEIALAQQATQIAASAQGLDWADDAPDAPWGVFRTAGEDDWCVVTVRQDQDWAVLCSIVPGLDPKLDHAARLSQRSAIDATLSAWLGERSATEAMTVLQQAGVPAAKMLRVSEQPDFVYYRERGIFRQEVHPHMAEPYFSEAMHVRSAAIAAPDARPAPLMGEQTEEVMREWLGLEESAVADLIERGVLEPVSEQVLSALQRAKEYSHE